MPSKPGLGLYCRKKSPAGAGTHHFVGVIDLAGLTSITFDASGGPNIGFDLASYGAVTVPEPGTLALLGLAGMGLARRRRKV
jgi:hypothetical protein